MSQHQGYDEVGQERPATEQERSRISRAAAQVFAI